MADELIRLSAVAVRALLRRGEVTPGDLVEAAANLFAMLRFLDARAGAIAVMPIPRNGLAEAIAGRLRRAARGSVGSSWICRPRSAGALQPPAIQSYLVSVKSAGRTGSAMTSAIASRNAMKLCDVLAEES